MKLVSWVLKIALPTCVSILLATEVWYPRLLQGSGASNVAKDIDGCYGMDSI